MKKIIFSILLLLVSSIKVNALPLGNPAEPNFLNRGVFWGGVCGDCYDPCAVWIDAWNVRMGYYGDFVFDRKLEVRGGNRDNIHNTQIFTNAGYAAINIGERLDIFGTLGATKIKIEQVEATWETTSVLSRESVGFLETNTDFSWSVGARAALIKCWGLVLGAEGQYFQSKVHLNRFYSTFLTGNAVFFDGNKVKYREWQAGLGLSYVISCGSSFWKIIPYAGVKWSWVRFNLRHLQLIVPDVFSVAPIRVLTFLDLKQQFHLGYAVGVSLIAWGNTALTLEGSWVSEKALYFNAQFRF